MLVFTESHRTPVVHDHYHRENETGLKIESHVSFLDRWRRSIHRLMSESQAGCAKDVPFSQEILGAPGGSQEKKGRRDVLGGR